MRQKTANPKTVEKYIDFLEVVKIQSNEHRITLQELVKNRNINKSVIKAFYELKIIQPNKESAYHYKWIGDEPSKHQALEVLNYCLELGKKQIVIPIHGLDDDTRSYIKAIHDHLISNANKQNITIDGPKLPLLSRALIQDTPTNLFSQIESNESKKFELLKAIASGVYTKVDGLTNEIDIDVYNSGIIDATEDLFNKFFKVK